MFCPSCGKQIPDQGVFCMFCGNRLDAPSTSPQTFNTHPPTNIEKLFFGFKGPVMQTKKGGTFSWDEVSRDGFWIGFSLVDEKKITQLSMTGWQQ